MQIQRGFVSVTQERTGTLYASWTKPVGASVRPDSLRHRPKRSSGLLSRSKSPKWADSVSEDGFVNPGCFQFHPQSPRPNPRAFSSHPKGLSSHSSSEALFRSSYISRDNLCSQCRGHLPFGPENETPLDWERSLPYRLGGRLVELSKHPKHPPKA